MEKKIIPAIIASSQEELAKRISKVKGHFSTLQLDVMDGIFVPTHSLDFDFKLPESGCRYEAHLMVADPQGWIEKNSGMADMILVHIESCNDPEKIIGLARSKGKKIGFVLNPQTGLGLIRPYLDKIDEALIMTVSPGYYGSPFLPETLKKVSELRAIRPDMEIEVDGGISPDTIKQASDAGANLFICGSYLQKSPDVKEAADVLRSKIHS
ncbi:ribulose-phosphate 3-epimerase [Candidatus Woesearchaeota archaeon]|nr:ribulose-phosphate 3-epimerase [Candidatus Woesearchaeota archaeon]